MAKKGQQLKLPAKKKPAKQKRISKKQRTIAKLAVQDLLRERYVRSFFGMPSNDELIDANNYVIAQDGLYLIRKNRVGLFVTHLANTKHPIPLVHLDRQPVEGFYMTIQNKIPYEYQLKTVAFFRRVYLEKKGAEAVVQIFYNRTTEEYFFHVDQQGVSGGGAEMDRNAELETEHVLVADIHSHNSMGAFFSPTDNRDEKEARVYGVMGRFDRPWPEIKFRAGNGQGTWLELSEFGIFQTPDVGTVEVPDEWMDKVHKPSDYRKKSNYYKAHGKQQYKSEVPWGEHYDRYVPPTRRLFGKAGAVDQDELVYPIERWEGEIDWKDEFQEDSVGISIESLIETAEILAGDECQSMWLSLVEKLDPHAKQALKIVLDK